MAITDQDIRKLERELQKDLEAVARVKALLTRKNGTESATSSGSGEAGQLKQLCIEAVKASGADGIRPKDVVKVVETRGYKFKSKQGAAASVSTALRRLFDDKKVDKKDGKYFWKGKTASE